MTNTLLRFELTITRDGSDTDVVHTFTWGESRTAAYARVVDTMDADPGWDGWSFELAKTPTA